MPEFDIFGEGGSDTYLSKLFGKAREDRHFEILLWLADKGAVAGVSAYFNRHASCDHARKDRERIISMLLDEPKRFPSPELLVREISKGVAFERYMKGRDADPVASVWGMHAKHPRDGIARAAGYLAAEYLRANILADDTFKPDFSAMLVGPHIPEESRESIMAVQSALVDMVRNEGRASAVNTGVGLLSFMTPELPEDVRRSWTKKIVGFEDKTRYSLAHGDVRIVTPVYEA